MSLIVLCKFMLLILAISVGTAVTKIDSSIVNYRDVEKIFFNVSKNIEASNGSLPLATIELYENRTLTVLENTNRTLWELRQPSRSVDFLFYLRSLNVNLSYDTFSHVNATWEYLSNFPKMLQHVREKKCDLHMPPTQFLLYRLYVAGVDFFTNAFVNLVREYVESMITSQNITETHLSYKQEINEQRIALQDFVSEKRELMKLRLNQSISWRLIRNCQAKTIVRDKSRLDRTRNFVLPDFKSPDKCGSCNFLSRRKNSCKGQLQECLPQTKISYCIAEIQNVSHYAYIEVQDHGTYQSNYVSPLTRGFAPVTWRYGKRAFCKTDGNGEADQLQSVKTDGDCSACICKCQESEIVPKNLFLSTQVVMSDVEMRKVITGVRFVKHEGTIYTQIKQGELMPGGWINGSTNEWKKIDYLSAEDVSREENLISIKANQLKRINTGSLHCPVNSVLVGVRMKVKNISTVDLSIMCVVVEWQKGKMVSGTFNVHHKKKRYSTVTLRLDEVDNNSAVRDLTWPQDSSSSAGFDGQDVTSSIGLPLAGAGLYQRPDNSSSDVIAYRLYSIDYARSPFL